MSTPYTRVNGSRLELLGGWLESVSEVFVDEFVLGPQVIPSNFCCNYLVEFQISLEDANASAAGL